MWKAFHDWTNVTRPRYIRSRLREYGVERSGPYYKATILGAEMIFTKPHMSNVINELDSWETEYLPTDVTGKVVLSVGDGCGETSLFYLRRGATKVIAIEKDDEAFGLLRRNASFNHLNVEPIHDSFKLEHLAIKHDFLKVDIEGGESALLELEPGSLMPCVIEAHRFADRELPEKLMQRFGLTKIRSNGRNAVLLTNVRS